MGSSSMKIVICGLSITSSWGNGHATTYRSLVKALVSRGHDVLFLERDVPWYAARRDMPTPPFGRTMLYSSLAELRESASRDVREADLVIVGSYVPDGVAVGQWAVANARGAVAFYDLDTPVTLAKLAAGDYEYLSPEMIPRYHLYLSFTGGPTLARLERDYGARAARPLYCSADPEVHHPMNVDPQWDLGYLGTYNPDRQPALERLLVRPARLWPEGSFVVAGPQYPASYPWPQNVDRIDHLSPGEHPAFYKAQRFTLNVTRTDMVRAGWCPSVRLFEAAACGTPVLSDYWKGMGEFFTPGREIFVVSSTRAALEALRRMPERERLGAGRRALARVLSEHTSEHRAETLECYAREALDRMARPATREPAAAGS